MIDYRDVSDAAKAQMKIWFSQRPTFALMGEFSAGKSTLLNVLMGWSVLPAMVTATKLPMIWITHSEESTCHGLTSEGELRALDSMTPDPDEWARYAVVRITLSAPILELCDVIDTPGISDPRLSAGSLRFIAEYADFAIWCTAANQAWRQSEKAAWSALPERLRDSSILAVTRADQLGETADLRKVLKRMQSETGKLFRDIQPIASLRAMSAVRHGKIINQIAWHDSGAADLQVAIKQSISVAQAACDTRVTPKAEPATMRLQPTPTERTDIVADYRAAIADIEKPLTEIKVSATIQHLRDALLNDVRYDDAHAKVLARCLSLGNSDQLDLSRALKQMEQDVEDFAEGAWCRLDKQESGKAGA